MLNNTHYDILKVTRDASSDAIHAAYKELTQQYLSDSTPSVQATNLMKIVHYSYAILSNPVQKLKYDQWLQELEVTQVEFTARETAQPPPEITGKRTRLPDFKPIAAPPPSADNPSAIPNSVLVSPDIHHHTEESAETLASTPSLTHARAKQQDIAGAMYTEVYPTVPPNGSYPVIRPETAGEKFRSWPKMAALGLLALSAVLWFVFADSSDDSMSVPAEPAERQAKTPDSTLTTVPAPQGTDTQTNADGQDIPNPLTLALPDHDKAALSAFTGIWKGRDPDVLQTLDITTKSDSSLVFRLKAKSGENSGEIYGIADYTNGYAQFYNQEYNCNILFTMNSGALRLDTSSCQEYHETGATFDGTYGKPTAAKEVKKPSQASAKPVKSGAAANRAGAEKTKTTNPAAPVTKLRKFSATVKDSAGNVSTIELVAKDKDAAKAILRDFRGNPKVIKLKEVKN